MTSTHLYRITGLALLIGAIAIAISNVVSGVLFPDNSDPAAVASPLNAGLTLLGVIGGILLLFGLPGLYLSRARTGGVVWFIGNVLLGLTAVLFGIFLPLMFLLVLPTLAAAAPGLLSDGPPSSFLPLFIIGTLANVLGAALAAWAVLARRLYPAGIGWLLVLEAVLAAVSFVLNGPTSAGAIGQVLNVVSGLPLFAVIGWIGLQLFAGKSTEGDFASERLGRSEVAAA